MLGRLALFSIRRRRWIFVLTIVLAVVAVFGTGSVANRVKSEGFDDPNSESAKTSQEIFDQFQTGNPNVTFLVSVDSGSVDDANAINQGYALVAEVRNIERAADVTSYWTTPGADSLRSKDGKSALVLARIPGTEKFIANATANVAEQFSKNDRGITVVVGGLSEINHEVNERIEKEIPRAELISLPLILLLLMFVFGGLVAAAVPVVVGVLAILGALLVLRVLAGVTDVSVYAINITTMMGLGLAIDYSLFIVSRYREELRVGLDRDDAIVRAVQTGGRTVLFSAAAVAISLSALAAFPMYFLTSLAYAGVSVVAFAALVSVTFLPALLAAIGPRIDALRIRRKDTVEPGPGIWGKVARVVMRRPLIVAITTLAILAFVGSPFLNVDFGTGDERALPKDSPARIVSEKIRNDFPSEDSYPITVLATGIDDPLDHASDLADYASDLSNIRNVARVEAITGTYVNGEIVTSATANAGMLHNESATVLRVFTSVQPMSSAGETVVRDVRKLQAPFEVGVTGVTATTVDSNDVLLQRLPFAAAGIAVVMLVVLFLLTGSVLLPIKTVLLSVVSLTATFGAMVWVFQDGHLGWLFNIDGTGVTDSTNPLLMFCVAFGLSMDYAVFLLARIKEEYDSGLTTEQAVVRGLEKSGRVVTAAAALIAIVFFSFGTSSVVFLKLIGIGLALAIVVDATIIRGLLVPSFMRLLGQANWWAPKFLKPLHARFGISETSQTVVETKQTASVLE